MSQAPYPPPPGYPMPGQPSTQGYPGPAVPAAPAPAAVAPAGGPALPPLPEGWEYGPGNVPRPVQAAPAAAPAPAAPAAPAPAAPAYAAPPAALPGQAAALPGQAAALPGQAAAGGFPTQNIAHLGAAIADATLGVTRYPSLLEGEYVLLIDLTTKPERSLALVAEFTVESSTNPDRPVGMQVSWYQNLSGPDPRALAAQHGAALAFILRATGFATREAVAAHGWTSEQLAAHINACFQRPGPLAGRRVRVVVSDSGKRTKAKQDGTGGGLVIWNHAWSPA